MHNIKLFGYKVGIKFNKSFSFVKQHNYVTKIVNGYIYLDSQALLNVFTKWYQWANSIICIDKCRCFVIKKNGKQSTQNRHYLNVNNEMIPTVKLNDSFVYLGKEFYYNMPCENVKFDIAKRLSDYLEKIDILSLHPKHKINILTKFVYSKLRWDLTIHHFPETWVVQNLGNKANRCICKWLGIPISGKVNHLCLKAKQLGISLKFPSDTYRLNQITVRNILKSSKNQSMRERSEITGMKSIRNDSIGKRSANAEIAKSTLDKEIQNEIMTSVNSLKEQNTLMSSLQQKVSR